MKDEPGECITCAVTWVGVLCVCNQELPPVSVCQIKTNKRWNKSSRMFLIFMFENCVLLLMFNITSLWKDIKWNIDILKLYFILDVEVVFHTVFRPGHNIRGWLRIKDDLCICLSICLSIYLSIYLSVYISITLPVYPSVYISIYLSLYVSVLLLSSGRSSVDPRIRNTIKGTKWKAESKIRNGWDTSSGKWKYQWLEAIQIMRS